MSEKSYDFSGWATRNNLRCSDGRTIRKDCFKHQNGKKVPLVWNHQHGEIGDVLGHAILENREEGVYAYGYLNHTENGEYAKELLEHGDIEALSIYAGQLKEIGGDVIHGNIKEVSLVLAGANPGAVIDTVLEHSDGTISEGAFYMNESDSDLIIHSYTESEETDSNYTSESEDEKEKEKENEKENEKMLTNNDIHHADEGTTSAEEITAKEAKDIFDSMTEEQKNVCYALIAQAIEDTKAEMNDKGEEGEKNMKHNAFDNAQEKTNVLSHSDMKAIFDDAKRCGSLKEATMQYAETTLAHSDDEEEAYGITDIDYLFPDYKAITSEPELVARDQEWVSVVMKGVKHVPFARIKSLFANITADEARAKGYTKGNKKLEEVFALLKRTTDPQMIYKKQKLDREDIIDIVDFDVVIWLKKEMRLMLDEEIARAILIGDGRTALSPDKIKEEHIRPILNDDPFYSVKKTVTFVEADTDDQKAKKVIRAAIKARKDYKGSGMPVMFTTEDWLTDMLLLEDKNDRVIYDTKEKLATALRVKDIITVPVMENSTRVDATTSTTYATIAIVVDLNDYAVGADKGGEVSLFDDFDIDYNQQKYLIETRCSGALVKYHSAYVLETEVVEPDPDPEPEDDEEEENPDALG